MEMNGRCCLGVQFRAVRRRGVSVLKVADPMRGQAEFLPIFSYLLWPHWDLVVVLGLHGTM